VRCQARAAVDLICSTGSAKIEMITSGDSKSASDMSAEVKKEIQLEIAHVLFVDIVGYSKLSINEQNAVVDELIQIVRATSEGRGIGAPDQNLHRRRDSTSLLHQCGSASALRDGTEPRA
jgi:hypothetical protein